MKKLILPILFLTTITALAQPIIQWQNTLGGSGEDYLYSIQQTSDGGYILGGLSLSNISGDKTENSQGSFDYWVVKLDASGVIQWQNTIGGNDTDVLESIQQTSDGGYILGGGSSSNISGDKTENSQGSMDYWVVKLDTSGTIQWQKTIGGSGYDVLFTIQQTSDSGYILGGRSESDISGDKTENSQGADDYWVVKLDTSGAIQWQNTIGGTGYDNLYSIQQTSDGGYFLGGRSESDISGDKTENSQGSFDYWVVKLDTSGTIQWQNTIGGSDTDWLESIQQTSDGGYILGGSSLSNISGDKTENSQGVDDYWVVKLCWTDSTYTGQITICEGDSVLIFGFYQSTAGTYYNTLTNMNGCDSIIAATLILTAYTISDPAIAICNGDSVSIYDIYRSVAGTYYDSATTTNGCDSIHSTVVTVDQLPTVNLGADTMICNGCSITLDAGPGFASYNWSTGATTQTITVDSTATYIVQITNANGCINADTIVVDILSGINQYPISNINLDIHPNPNTGEFTVTFKIIEKQNINLKVFNIKGQIIYQENLSDFTGKYQNKIDMSGYAKGIYSLQLSTKEKIINRKIIIEK